MHELYPDQRTQVYLLPNLRNRDFSGWTVVAPHSLEIAGELFVESPQNNAIATEPQH